MVHLANFVVNIAYTAPDSPSTLTCAVFSDVDDGLHVGRVLAAEILERFVQLYVQPAHSSTPSSAIDTVFWNQNMSRFSVDFHAHLPDTFRGCVRPIVLDLVSGKHRSIRSAVLVSGPSVVFTTMPAVDAVALVANLAALMNLATDMMATVNDAPRIVTLAGAGPGKTTVRIYFAEEDYVLVVLFKPHSDYASSVEASDSALGSLRRVFALLKNIQNTPSLRNLSAGPRI
jgi:hypothetical protein